MFEICRRAHAAQDAHVKRIDWNTYIPDEREGESHPSELLDETEPSWFKVKSSHGYQHPSVVWVEDVVLRDDVTRVPKNVRDIHQRRDASGRWKDVQSVGRFLKKDTRDTYTLGEKSKIEVKQHTNVNHQDATAVKQGSGQGLQTDKTGGNAKQQNVEGVDTTQRKFGSSENGKGRNSLATEQVSPVAGCVDAHKGKGKDTDITKNKTRSTVDRQSVNVSKLSEKGSLTVSQDTPRERKANFSVSAKPSGVLRRLELDAEGFFNFLFSDRWEEGCLVRVLPGKLLDNILHALTKLEKFHDVISYATIAYIYNKRPILPSIKTAAEKMDHEWVTERVLVEFDCFCPQERPEVIIQQLQMTKELSSKYQSNVSVPVEKSCDLDGSGGDSRITGVSFSNTIQDNDRHAPCVIKTSSLDSKRLHISGANETQAPLTKEHSSDTKPNTKSSTKHETHSSQAIPDSVTNTDGGLASNSTIQQSYIKDLPGDSTTQQNDTRDTQSSTTQQSDTSKGLPSDTVIQQSDIKDLPRDSRTQQSDTSRDRPYDSATQDNDAANVFSGAAPVTKTTRESALTTSADTTEAELHTIQVSHSIGIRPPHVRQLSSHEEKSHDIGRDNKGQQLSVENVTIPAQVCGEGEVQEPSFPNSSITVKNERPSSDGRLHLCVSDQPEGPSGSDSSVSDKAITSTELPGVKCNIRGITQPPPHKNCLRPYHMVREPFLHRWHRQQSAFPRIHLPEIAIKIISEKEKGEDFEDEKYLGTILKDDTELVASTTSLRMIPCLSEEEQISDVKSSKSSFSKQLAKEQQEQLKAAKKRKGAKEAMEEDTDDFYDMEKKTEKLRSYLEPIRERKFLKDVDQMLKELVVNQTVPKTMKKNVHNKLKNANEAKHLTGQPAFAENSKWKKSPELRLQKIATYSLSKLDGQPMHSTDSVNVPSLSYQHAPTPDSPFNFLKKWDKTPTFNEFYQYLLQEDLDTKFFTGPVSGAIKPRAGLESSLQDRRLEVSVSGEQDGKTKVKKGKDSATKCKPVQDVRTPSKSKVKKTKKEKLGENSGDDDERTAVSKKKSKNYGDDDERTAVSKKKSKNYGDDDERTAVSKKKSKNSGDDDEPTAVSKKKSKNYGDDDERTAVSKKKSKNYGDDDERTAVIKKKGKSSKSVHILDTKRNGSEQGFGETSQSNKTKAGKHSTLMKLHAHTRIQLAAHKTPQHRKQDSAKLFPALPPQLTAEQLLKQASMGITLSGTHLLTEEQERLWLEEEFIMSSLDPWHVSVRFAFMAGGVCDSVGVRNDLLRRRENIFRLIKESKEIVKQTREDVRQALKKQQDKIAEQQEQLKAAKKAKELIKRSAPETGKLDGKSCLIKKKERSTKGKRAIAKTELGMDSKTRMKKTADDSGEDEIRKEPRNAQRQKKQKIKDTGSHVVHTAETGIKKRSKNKQLDSGGEDPLASQDSYLYIKRGYGKGSPDKAKPTQSEVTKAEKQKSKRKADGQERDDYGIPDDTSPEDLFRMMKLNAIFDPTKLHSAYSFEKMYQHRQDEIPDYSKLLKMFEKPFKRRKKSPKTRVKLKPKPETQEFVEPEEPSIEESPPVPAPFVLGKLREFRFLQHKNHKPEVFKCPDQVKKEMSQEDFCQNLILAMQMFVVRKERATTTFGTCQYKSKASVTFTKRQAGEGWVGVPPLVDTRKMVAAVCQTLKTCC